MRIRITKPTIDTLIRHMAGPQPVIAGQRHTAILARHDLIFFKSPFRPRRSMLTRKGRALAYAITGQRP